jgi:esterase/lipase
MSMENEISIISVAINLARLISDMRKYTDKKFEKILKELRNYKISPENITNILSVIIKGAKLRANRSNETSRDF